MRVRAQRFQTDLKLPEYAPAEQPEDEVKKQLRAARFGVEYAPADRGALMEIGEHCTFPHHSAPSQTPLLSLTSRSAEHACQPPASGWHAWPSSWCVRAQSLLR